MGDSFLQILPDRCVLFSKFNFTSEELLYLQKIKSINTEFTFKVKANFLVFDNIDVIHEFSTTVKDSKLTNLALLPAYVKINGMFLTMSNFNKMASTYKKNDLEKQVIQYLEAPVYSYSYLPCKIISNLLGDDFLMDKFKL